MTQQTRLPPKKISPRTLERLMAPGAVHIGRGLYRSEICGGGTCTPHQANNQRKLHSHNRVGRQKIRRHYTRLGLQEKTSAYFTTRLHQEGSQAVQPQTSEKSKPTMPKHPYQVWDQKSVCHATIIGTTS